MKVFAYIRLSLHRFTNIFTHNDEKILIGQLYQNQELILGNVIALARLLFVKPEDLKRESDKKEDNMDYLVKYNKKNVS